MQFKHKESKHGADMLAIKSNQHVEVEFLFKDESATHVYINGEEFSMAAEMLYGLFVAIGDEMVSLLDLGRKAEEEYPAIMREVAQEDSEAADMERELSSPYLTGRI